MLIFRKRKTTRFLYVHLKDTKGLPLYELFKQARRDGELDTGYHFYIQKGGLVEQGREIEAIGGYTFKNNEESLFILLDCTLRKINDSQKITLSDLIKTIKETYSDIEVIYQ